MPENPMMIQLGKLYEALFQLPYIGETLVRKWVRGLGTIVYYAPFSGVSRQANLEGVKSTLERMVRIMKFDVEILNDSEEPDSFEFLVHCCPYGYNRADQQGVCDAAMDMDRVMFRHVGAEMIIKEAIVYGAPACRVQMKDLTKKQ